MPEKSIAIITARGGSKRIPRKNIKPFFGKPIMQYAVEAALASHIFDEVMVSTDDKEIKELALNCGAKVPFLRSEETSNDYATTRDVLVEVIQNYQKLGMEFDYMACIYPTNPFVTAEKLVALMNRLKTCDCSEVEAVVGFSFPPQRAYIMQDGFLEPKWRENYNMRSQDLEKMYHDAGQMYAYRMSDFFDLEKLARRRMPLFLKEYEVMDIDTEDDWEMAEIRYEIIKKRGLI